MLHIVERCPLLSILEGDVLRLAIIAVLGGLGTLLVSSGCGNGGDVAYNPSPRTTAQPDQAHDQGQEPLVIQDRTGKTWDVAHALNYNMQPAGFQYGLGPFAIKPIMDPRMLSPGDQNYPANFDNFRVMGTSLNGFTRAYPIDVMSRHEVANEQFGETHVAVAY